MAFILNRIDEKHVSCNYWKVKNIRQDLDGECTEFDLCLYINKEAFLTGAEPYSIINFYEVPGQLNESQCDAFVLLREEFSEAVADI